MKRPDRGALDGAIIAAHDVGDPAQLSDLYHQAATALDAAGDINAACFFLTHAYIFALEAGADNANQLHAMLKAKGRM